VFSEAWLQIARTVRMEDRPERISDDIGRRLVIDLRQSEILRLVRELREFIRMYGVLSESPIT